MPLDTLLIDYFISNLTRAIYQQIGLDKDKYFTAKNIVRENLYNCFLFREDLMIKSINDFEENIKMFIDKCINDVLESLV